MQFWKSQLNKWSKILLIIACLAVFLLGLMFFLTPTISNGLSETDLTSQQKQFVANIIDQYRGDRQDFRIRFVKLQSSAVASSCPMPKVLKVRPGEAFSCGQAVLPPENNYQIRVDQYIWPGIRIFTTDYYTKTIHSWNPWHSFDRGAEE